MEFLRSIWLLFALQVFSMLLLKAVVVKAESFADEALNIHNEYRAKHQNTMPLKWNNGLARSSQAYAQKMADYNIWAHDQANTYGENLYKATGGSNVGVSKAVKAWYDESIGYDYNSNLIDYSAGHFTQVVWKNTKELGCGIAKKGPPKMQTVYVVCRYNPPGNYRSQFLDNVKPLKGSVGGGSVVIPDPISPVASKCTDKNSHCSFFKSKCEVQIYSRFLTKICSGTCANLCVQ